MVDAGRIAQAAGGIEPVFRNTPQFVSEPLSERLGLRLLVKIECVNPIRSFKGRGASWLLRTLEGRPEDLVCASAGNFGQGMAYAARAHGRRVTVFASTNANVLKVERMRALGAEVRLTGSDFDEAKEAARAHAAASGSMFVEDGAVPAIAEGAGTIGLELTGWPEPIDSVLVPLGNGALITGIGSWLRAHSAETRVVGVVAEQAPSMYLSWREGKVVTTDRADTVADGIAVRVPVRSAVEAMPAVVDEVVLVSEAQLVEAAGVCFRHLGLVVEPAGAAGLAAILASPEAFRRRLVATPICGGNVADPEALFR